MTLGEKQRVFTRLTALLIQHVYASGYEATFGEAWRPPEMVKIYAKDGRGSPNSLHPDRLALDLNLFRGGKYLQKTEDYEWLGKFWEKLAYGGIKTVWGGRFKSRPDGNHFSIEHEGRM